MDARVRPQVDQLHCPLDRGEGRLPDRPAGECQDGAVVVRIRIEVEHMAGRGGGYGNRFQHLLAPAFREVRNCLDQVQSLADEG